LLDKAIDLRSDDTEPSSEEETHVKVAAIALVTALLFALPALAGTQCSGCGGPDSDSDGFSDVFDNCSLVPNPTQCDADSDGYGNHCDCDYDQDNICAGSDFLILGTWFGQTVPPAPGDVDQDCDGIVAGSDFLLFGAGFGSPPLNGPGTSCGNAKGVPCP
jgi:hypothetical protein